VLDETQAAEALTAGARGVVLRSGPPAQLAACLAAVAQELFALSSTVAQALLRPRLAGGAPALPEALTPRESEVLQLLSLGLANKAIAARLGISDHTAKFHVNAILGKLGVQSRSEAIVRASRLGLVVL
jgi:two-component system nitrate/nitrite response regulator NarL